MRLIWSVMALAMLICAGLAIAAERDFGPETMNMAERFNITPDKRVAVIFPHRMHQEKLNRECGKCHLSPEGGGPLNVEIKNLTGPKNDFHLKFCWVCHRAMKVKRGVSCSTCHRQR